MLFYRSMRYFVSASAKGLPVLPVGVSLAAKRPPEATAKEVQERLFSDAKVAEDHIQNIFHVDTPGQAPKRAGCDTKLLGQ